MNVLRFTNFYQVGRSICPEYIICSSFYKADNNVLSRVRNLCSTREYYSDKKLTTEYDDEKKNCRSIHMTPKQLTNFEDIPGQVVSLFKSVRLEDMAKAPQPVFWYSAAALIPFIGPPLSFILFGYSPMLASMQLAFGATLCSFAGGMKWGYALHCTEEQKPTWENLGWAIVPQMIGWLGILMPAALGFILVTSGIALSTFVDLTATCYPPWFRAIRLGLTIPAVIGLLFTFLVKVFH